MVIKTTLTKEQRQEKLRLLTQKIMRSGVMNNPRYKDPVGVMVFCGEKYRRSSQPVTTA